MSIELVDSLLRTAIVSASVTLCAYPFRGIVSEFLKTKKLLILVLFLGPLLTPPILPGYISGICADRLLHYPMLRELVYMILLFLKFFPLPMLVYQFVPADYSGQSQYIFRLAVQQLPIFSRSRLRTSGRFFYRGPGRSYGAALSLVYISVFSEFEIASRMNIKSWNVIMYDAHCGGSPLAEVLWRLLPPTLLIFCLIIVFFFLLLTRKGMSKQIQKCSVPSSKRLMLFGTVLIGCSFFVISIVPISVLLIDSVRGISQLLRHFVLFGDLWSSLFFAFFSAILVYQGSIFCVRIFEHHHDSPLSLLLMASICLPGLIGVLPISLLAVGIFQNNLLNWLYNSPIPLLLVLIIYLFPYAILLQLLGRIKTSSPSQYLIEIGIGSSDKKVRSKFLFLRRFLYYKYHFWIFFLLFCWAYFDLQASAVLSPPGMTPVFVRLYNLMHFGRSDVLSSMVMFSVLIPIIVAIILQSTLRWFKMKVSHV